MQFSIFYGGSKSTKPEPKPITLGELIQLIKFDDTLKDQVKIAQSFKQSGNKEESVSYTHLTLPTKRIV